MSITAYRITKTEHATQAFEGEGARLYGGRWNSRGTCMVYTAATRSLATLEMMVHLDDISTIEDQFSIIPITFPEKLILRIPPIDLPENWFSAVVHPKTQFFGDRWISEKKSAVLEVPSAVTVGENNYLLNPDHPDFKLIRIQKAQTFQIGPRLGR